MIPNMRLVCLPSEFAFFGSIGVTTSAGTAVCAQTSLGDRRRNRTTAALLIVGMQYSSRTPCRREGIHLGHPNTALKRRAKLYVKAQNNIAVKGRKPSPAVRSPDYDGSLRANKPRKCTQEYRHASWERPGFSSQAYAASFATFIPAHRDWKRRGR